MHFLSRTLLQVDQVWRHRFIFYATAQSKPLERAVNVVDSKSDKELKRGASMAMRHVFRNFRPSKLTRWRKHVLSWYNLAVYRLFYDRQFRMSPFREKARCALYFISEQACGRNFDELKDLFDPSALSNFKRLLEDDHESKKFCSALSVEGNPIYREGIFDATFVVRGNRKSGFEISMVYVCHVDPKLYDRTKKQTVFKRNRLGGRDSFQMTIPADAYVYIVAWLTLAKPLEKSGDNDWTVQRFEPMAMFLNRKELD